MLQRQLLSLGGVLDVDGSGDADGDGGSSSVNWTDLFPMPPSAPSACVGGVLRLLYRLRIIDRHCRGTLHAHNSGSGAPETAISAWLGQFVRHGGLIHLRDRLLMAPSVVEVLTGAKTPSTRAHGLACLACLLRLVGGLMKVCVGRRNCVRLRPSARNECHFVLRVVAAPQLSAPGVDDEAGASVWDDTSRHALAVCLLELLRAASGEDVVDDAVGSPAQGGDDDDHTNTKRVRAGVLRCQPCRLEAAW